MSVTVTAFYKFAPVSEPAALQDELRELCIRHDIRGSILVAREGINATISGAEAGIRAVLDLLRAKPQFRNLVSKQSRAASHPFQRMKVKLKREIVTLGLEDVDPTRRVGTYVAARDWNALISDPAVTLLDTRNSYEVAIGTFAGAIDPGTRSFRQFPEFVAMSLDPKRHTKVAMFCTGGIRCEKASALLLSLGFPEVHHLEGGILRYLETVPEEESLWRGECFVFDERVAVGPGMAVGHHVMCRACGFPVERKAGETLRASACPACGGTIGREMT